MSRTNKHKKKLSKLVASPSIIGIEKPIFAAKEVNLFNPNSSLVGEIDLVVFNGELYHLEYKNSPKHSERGYDQLRLQRRFIREIIGYDGKLSTILMCGNKIETISPRYSFEDKRGRAHNGI